MVDLIAKKKAFIDTPVFVALLRGDPDAVRLFEDAALAKVTYVTSPVVLQKLLLFGGDAPMDLIERTVQILPSPDPRVIPALKALRNKIVHSNDALILASASADKCDWLITMDQGLLRAAPSAWSVRGNTSGLSKRAGLLTCACISTPEC